MRHATPQGNHPGWGLGGGRVDRDAVLARADLAGIISADLGPPSRGRKWLCPFHDDHDPSLGLGRDGLHFRCWACGAKGTAIDWLMKRHDLSFLEAVGRIDPRLLPTGGSPGGGPRSAPSPSCAGKPRPAPPPSPRRGRRDPPNTTPPGSPKAP